MVDLVEEKGKFILQKVSLPFWLFLRCCYFGLQTCNRNKLKLTPFLSPGSCFHLRLLSVLSKCPTITKYPTSQPGQTQISGGGVEQLLLLVLLLIRDD